MDHTGGHGALVGYLYQIVYFSEIVVRIQDLEPDTADAMLFAELAGRGSEIQAAHEWLGQDLALYDDEQTVLVQFKYSGFSKPIDKGDIGKIIESFRKSLKAAKSHGEKVTACILLTNRQLTSEAEKSWETSSRRFTETKWKKSSNYDLPTARKNLEIFAQSYGLIDPSDIQQRLHTLIGDIFDRTRTELIDFSLKDLRYAFTGSRDTRQLTLTELQPISTIALEQFAADSHLEPFLSGFVSRSMMRDLDEYRATRALIILHGSGGYGKTIALWKWLREQEELRVCKSAGQALSEYLISETLSEWMLLPATSNRYTEKSEAAVARLKHANPASRPPLFYLGIDGLDERVTPQTEAALQQLIEWFRREDRRADQGIPPIATLIVTCRDYDDFQNDWLRHEDITGLAGKAEFAHIQMDRFSDAEFVEALNMADISSEVRSMLRNSFIDPLQEVYADSLSQFDTLGTPVPERGIARLDSSMFEALRHPIVWSEFTLQSAHIQLQILMDEPGAWHELAKGFISRFLVKLRQRTRLDSTIALETLRSIAQHCASVSSEWYRKQDSWNTPVYSCGYWNNTEADRLYREARSHGVIEEQNQRWQWSYPWIFSYLSLNEQEHT